MFKCATEGLSNGNLWYFYILTQIDKVEEKMFSFPKSERRRVVEDTLT